MFFFVVCLTSVLAPLPQARAETGFLVQIEPSSDSSSRSGAGQECPVEIINQAFVDRMRWRYGPLSTVARQVTVNTNRQDDPNGGYIIEQGDLMLVKDIYDWNAEDITHVGIGDLSSLMVFAATHKYLTLSAIKPRYFRTVEQFGEAILQEWQRRGQTVPSALRPGYAGQNSRGEAIYCSS
jgi:hypothetical protein